ncbi:MAG: nicotinamide-nucleotide amidohydrolase family protein [Halomonadaceae bacterium]|nr:MAG: nicotinamide-nucleotide amidohydrolase family protein [Halomonadaceae bacterium]
MHATSHESLRQYAASLGLLLRDRGLTLSPAESCTGGWISKVLTDNAGSSDYLSAGLVTYSNGAKQALLGVKEESLAEFGAVSEQVVRQMVSGTLALTGADLAVAVSGVAGPGGGSEDKPVGTVWFAWGNRQGAMETRCHLFTGNRDAVRSQSVACALQGVTEFVRQQY